MFLIPVIGLALISLTGVWSFWNFLTWYLAAFWAFVGFLVLGVWVLIGALDKFSPNDFNARSLRFNCGRITAMFIATLLATMVLWGSCEANMNSVESYEWGW